MVTDKVSRLEASKEFNVPVEQIYAAWTNPEQLKQWWKPLGRQLEQVTNDLVHGGTVSYHFDGNNLTISGQYEEVKQNERLVYSWNWEFAGNDVENAAYKLTVDFLKKEQGSAIHITQEDTQNKETLHPNEHGWHKGLADLEKFLSGDQQSCEDALPTSSEAEEPGYRERPEQQKVGGG